MQKAQSESEGILAESWQVIQRGFPGYPYSWRVYFMDNFDENCWMISGVPHGLEISILVPIMNMHTRQEYMHMYILGG